MKKLSLILGMLTFIIACNNTQVNEKSNPKLELVWQTDSLLTTCESALYDSSTGVIYVANINNNPWDLDSNGFISTIDTTGKILDLKWVDSGLSGPKGMGIFGGKLYVNDIDRLVEIDIASKKITKSYHVEGEPHLNDVTVSSEGVVYSSGSSSNIVYSLHDGEFDEFFTDESFSRLNGLSAQEEGIYYLSSGNGEFGVYDFKTKKGNLLAKGFGNGDGIIRLKNNDFIVSNWKGQVFYIWHSDWSSKLLLDTRDEDIYSADLGYIPEHNLILVPTFFGNRVMCYKLNY